MKKLMSFGLVALVWQFGLVCQTYANSNDEKFVEKVKTEIAKLGTGPDARLKVTLKDKTRIDGYVVSSDKDQFVIRDSKTGQKVPVSYPTVSKARGHNTPAGVIVLIGVATVLVVLFVLLAHST